MVRLILQGIYLPKKMADLFALRHEHIDGTHLASRDIQAPQARTDGHDRGIVDCVWSYVELRE